MLLLIFNKSIIVTVTILFSELRTIKNYINWSMHLMTKTTLKSKNDRKYIFRFWETFFHLVSHSFLIFPSSVILSNALKQRCCNVVWVFATTNAFSLRNIALKMLTLCISMQIRGETCSFLIFKNASWMSASLPLSLRTK